MTEEREYKGPLPIILDDEPFELSYMTYNEALYSQFYKEKAESFLRKLAVNGKISHQFQLTEALHLDTTHPNFTLPDRMSAICSPAKHCRERVRFPIFPRSAFSAIEALFPEKVERFRAGKPENLEKSTELVYTMWEGGGGSVLVHTFPIASKVIYDLMPHLLELINAAPVIKSQLELIHFHSTTTGEVMALLTYDHPLDEESWRSNAEELHAQLNSRGVPGVKQISIIARSKGQKIVVGEDFVYEQLTLPNGRIVRYKQVEQGFSNPNSAINAKVLGWMATAIQEEFGELATSIDLLEMFCGNGNHTVALSPFFRQVFAVEINGFLVDAAKENLALNGINNARVLKCDSSNFAMRVLKQQKYTWKETVSDGNISTEGASSTTSTPVERLIEYDFQAVIVDPPRAGLDRRTIQAVSQYPFIIYISCNPDRLLENLEELSQTHTVMKLAIIDHFAYTPHLEVAVILKKV